MHNVIQELTNEINKTARAAVNNVHTAIPGKVLSLDLKTGLAAVQPYGKYVTSDHVKLDYPVLTDVPLVFPFSQTFGCGIVFPVQPGDDCLVIFSEIGLDAWMSGAESEGLLRFDLSSAVAIPGMIREAGSLVSQANESHAVVISGNLIVTGNLVAGGIQMNTHTHTSGEAGSSTSGPR